MDPSARKELKFLRNPQFSNKFKETGKYYLGEFERKRVELKIKSSENNKLLKELEGIRRERDAIEDRYTETVAHIKKNNDQVLELTREFQHITGFINLASLFFDKSEDDIPKSEKSEKFEKSDSEDDNKSEKSEKSDSEDDNKSEKSEKSDSEDDNKSEKSEKSDNKEKSNKDNDFLNYKRREYVCHRNIHEDSDDSDKESGDLVNFGPIRLVPDNLATLISVPAGTEMSVPEVVLKVQNVIRNKHLVCTADKIILDDELMTVLDIELPGSGKEIHFFDLVQTIKSIMTEKYNNSDIDDSVFQ